jgi:hypothetical protein
MNGPPMTRLEVAEALRRKVRRYGWCQADEAAAISAVAAQYGVDSEWVAEMVARADRALGGGA